MPYRSEEHTCTCGRPYEASRFRGMPVLECRGCEKTWVDLSALTELIERESKQSFCARTMPRGLKSEAKCGICQRRMRELLFGGTRVNWCVRHGFLFDEGQLSHITATYEDWLWK